MLRKILNKSWSQHPTKQQLYGHVLPIMQTIQVSRIRYASNCWKCRDELIRDIPLWAPSYRRAKAGRPVRIYKQQLCADTGCSHDDLQGAMDDRDVWSETVKEIRAGGTT